MGRGDDQGQTIRLRVRHTAQQDRVKHAEYRRVDTDTNGERGDHDQGESRALAKLPQGEAEVFPECHCAPLSIRDARALPEEGLWNSRLSPPLAAGGVRLWDSDARTRAHFFPDFKLLLSKYSIENWLS